MRILVLSVALLSAAPLLANDNVATTATTTAADPASSRAPEEPKAAKVCKRIDASEGRLASKKVCLSAEEWKKRQPEGA